MKQLNQILVLLCFLLPGSLACAQANQELLVKLQHIAEADQKYRGAVIESAAAAHGWSSKEVQEIWAKQTAIDIANLAEVENIISKYGYPGKSLIGEQLKSVAYLVIQHSAQETQEKYLPLLKQAAESGELAKASVALLIDRVKVGRGEAQVYGSQLSEDDAGVKLYPIEEEHKVNERRAQVGLPPLEDYLSHWGIKYKIPTATSNSNPPDLYVEHIAREVEPHAAVELIGGEEKLYQQLKYPAQAQANHIKGKVLVEFVIDAAGNVADAFVVQGLGHGCDEEALRVIKQAKFKNSTGHDHARRMRLPFGE
ncbi:TonB family protein [Pontibacter rugosus]|uniref:TonB family protein n=1 Tax=Pontibacter rugosus TaxID=1745966 RepID=A0ABW3SJ26_9BACT